MSGQTASSSMHALGPISVPVWPEGTGMTHIEPMICVVTFPDNESIRQIAEPKLLDAAKDFRVAEPDRWPGGGGAKIRDIGDWPCAAMTLLHKRAMEAFKRLTKAEKAIIDDSWASVYEPGEFIGPHAHRRTSVSVVYHLTPPEPEDCERFDGALGITDPRVRRCCPTKPGFVTSQVYPPLDPGTMVLFPSFVTHYVTPHRSPSPRISIAWNIDSEEIPGSAAEEPLL